MSEIAASPCDAPASTLVAPGDLTLLVHRAAQGLRCVLDRACRDEGLGDGRDWLVLSVLTDGIPRTQLDLSRVVGIDKTTLTSLLDRLERDGLIVRRADPADRRARIPEATDDGRAVCTAVARSRDEVERSVLGDLTPEQDRQFREILVRIAGVGGLPSHPPCA